MLVLCSVTSLGGSVPFWKLSLRGGEGSGPPLGPLRRRVERSGWPGKGRKEPPTKPGWEEPRTTARAQRSANYPCHHRGAHDTRVNHKRARATRGGAHDTRGNHEGARNTPVHYAQEREKLGGRQVADNQDNTRRGLTHTETWHGMWWTTWMWRGVGSKNRKTTPATTSTTPARRLLGSANTETTPQGTQAAVAVRRH